MKKTFSIILIFTLLFTFSSFSFAESNNNNYLQTDNMKSELVLIDGIEYRYDFSFDLDNNQTIMITNTQNNLVDIIVINETDKIVSLNGDHILEYSSVLSNGFLNTLLPNDTWTQLGTTSTKYFTWPSSTTVTVLAGIIAGFAKTPVTIVITQIGSGILNTLASTGGSAHVTLEIFWNGPFANPPMHWFHWLFVNDVTGVQYGWFNYYEILSAGI